jgi:predicted RNase H-like nuclease (RuvC/YqgF family)
MATLTDTETESTVFISNGKSKKYLQDNDKYPMRLCKACNIKVAENYLSNHKKTSKHILNQSKYEEGQKKGTVDYVYNKLNNEIKELEYKINDFKKSNESLILHTENMKKELHDLENERADITEKMHHSIHHLKNMEAEKTTFEENINKLNIELEKKRLIFTYMKEL